MNLISSLRSSPKQSSVVELSYSVHIILRLGVYPAPDDACVVRSSCRCARDAHEDRRKRHPIEFMFQNADSGRMYRLEETIRDLDLGSYITVQDVSLQKRGPGWFYVLGTIRQNLVPVCMLHGGRIIQLCM